MEVSPEHYSPVSRVLLMAHFSMNAVDTEVAMVERVAVKVSVEKVVLEKVAADMRAVEDTTREASARNCVTT